MIRFTFYTDSARGNVLAQFRLDAEIPGAWTQSSRGTIIMGRENRERVLWPKGAQHFHTTPATREDTARAEAEILRRWREFRDLHLRTAR